MQFDKILTIRRGAREINCRKILNACTECQRVSIKCTIRALCVRDALEKEVTRQNQIQLSRGASAPLYRRQRVKLPQVQNRMTFFLTVVWRAHSTEVSYNPICSFVSPPLLRVPSPTPQKFPQPPSYLTVFTAVVLQQ